MILLRSIRCHLVCRSICQSSHKLLPFITPGNTANAILQNGPVRSVNQITRLQIGHQEFTVDSDHGNECGIGIRVGCQSAK